MSAFMQDQQPPANRVDQPYSGDMATKNPESGAKAFRPTYCRIKLLASTQAMVELSNEVLAKVRVLR